MVILLPRCVLLTIPRHLFKARHLFHIWRSLLGVYMRLGIYLGEAFKQGNMVARFQCMYKCCTNHVRMEWSSRVAIKQNGCPIECIMCWAHISLETYTSGLIKAYLWFLVLRYKTGDYWNLELLLLSSSCQKLCTQITQSWYYSQGFF